MTSPDSGALQSAWQAALAAEHQAVFGYGLLGPRLLTADQRLALACSTAHETLRNDVAARMAVDGLTPAAAEPDYPALYPVPDAAAARRLAVRIEDACALAWRYLYAQSVASPAARARTLRPEAQKQLIAAAVRGTRWRSLIDPAKATTAFPGIS